MWSLWPPVPLVDEVHHVVHVDGIHLHRDAVVLIAVAGGHVIGWHVLLQCLFDRFGSVFPQCGLMVFPGVVIVSR